MSIAEVLGPEGPLARQIAGFAVRPQQQQMAEAVAQALTDNGVLLAEAGTGTGKTFAYLVPALLSGKKIIVSTGTRNLQDQLYHKDLPVVRQALAATVRVALLKGRANYLCLYRLERVSSEGRLGDRRLMTELARIRGWSGRTRRGDIAEVSDVAEDSALWPRVTSTAETCLGQECPRIRDCFLFKARREAQEADVLIINHHLFFADMAVRQEGFAEVLPGADAFIIDEAHQLPDLAGHFFGLALSSRQLSELARDTQVEQARDAPDSVDLVERSEVLERATAELRLAFGLQPRRDAWAAVAGVPDVREALATLQAALEDLHESLQQAAERGKGLASCCQRCGQQRERLTAFAADEDARQVRWFETQPRSFMLHLTPLDIADKFRAFMANQPKAWVFTSATLAVGEGFQHFTSRLGLEPSAVLRLPSPFDFARRAVLYHPKGLPDPASPQYTAALIEAVLPTLDASGGRAFLLFTSHQSLQEAARLLAGRMAYPLLVQGTLPKNELLARFRELGNAVLLGTASFWEGVDVRGEALSLVSIAKLPFASPSDPVVQARIKALRQQGGDPFTDYQLPQAVLTLKQGVGRLIRDVHDRGVLMLCDPRLLTRSYGRVFLDSLPPMARTRELAQVRRFFALPVAAADEP